MRRRECLGCEVIHGIMHRGLHGGKDVAALAFRTQQAWLPQHSKPLPLRHRLRLECRVVLMHWITQVTWHDDKDMGKLAWHVQLMQ